MFMQYALLVIKLEFKYFEIQWFHVTNLAFLVTERYRSFKKNTSESFSGYLPMMNPIVSCHSYWSSDYRNVGLVGIFTKHK
jgi:hypothetical protein